MDKLIVSGPTPLHGETFVSGAKNAISKLLAASMLTAEPCSFSNVPKIGDTQVTKAICKALGTTFEQPSDRTLDVMTPAIRATEVPEQLAKQNRLSIMMLGPLLHRQGTADIHMAGGDRIGPRPIDFHLNAYKAMGARVHMKDDVYHVQADGLKGADITLPFPSVTATENILMAATLAKGTTYIRNAAIEPEIIDLALFLQKMGAIIDQQVDRTFVIEGVQRLTGAAHTIMPDRLVSASLGAAAIASGGDIFIRGAQQADLLTFLNTLRRVGGGFEIANDGIRFYHKGPLRSIALETTVHPGFMTDWQPPFVMLLTQAHGMSVVHETVFEDRFIYVEELQKMGADIELYDNCLGGTTCRFKTSGNKHSAIIKGPTRLKGTTIHIPDLRAGFSHLIAAILAEGESNLFGVEQIDRGYEQIEATLRDLGANIERQKIS